MPIEFRCRKCLQKLRVADETAGKSARCPECGLVQPIPHPEAPDAPASASPSGGAIPDGPPPPPPFTPSDASPPSPESGDSPFSTPRQPDESFDTSPFGDSEPSDNPYQSPAGAMGEPARPLATSGGPIRPTRIEIGEVFRVAWDAVTVNLGPCLLAGLILVGVGFAFGIMAPLVAPPPQPGPGMQVNVTPQGFALDLVRTLVTIWLSLGMTIFTLQCVRGQSPDVANVFRGGPYFLRALGAAILIWLMFAAIVGVLATLGFAAFLVDRQLAVIVAVSLVLVSFLPLVFLFLMFFWYQALIVDKNVGVMDSLRLSREIMRGNLLSVFLILFVASILGGIVTLCTCFVGAIAVAPFSAILTTTIYLMASGQPVAMRGGPLPEQKEGQATF